MKELYSGCLGEWFLDDADPCPMPRDCLGDAFALVCTIHAPGGDEGRDLSLPRYRPHLPQLGTALSCSKPGCSWAFVFVPSSPFPCPGWPHQFLMPLSTGCTTESSAPVRAYWKPCPAGEKSYWSIGCCPVMSRSNSRRKVLSVSFKSAKWAMAARI